LPTIFHRIDRAAKPLKHRASRSDAGQNEMKKISDLFTDEEKEQLSYLGSMLHQEPTEEEQKQQRIIDELDSPEYRPWKLKTYLAFDQKTTAPRFEQYLNRAQAGRFVSVASTKSPARSSRATALAPPRFRPR
jgi:hypothetical protein